ncbi:hypothetical protein Btru_046010 [Bulinus truncatus]|nr:hypothetical protein Btru_046010 [Bulinus truncatus]
MGHYQNELSTNGNESVERFHKCSLKFDIRTETAEECRAAHGICVCSQLAAFGWFNIMNRFHCLLRKLDAEVKRSAGVLDRGHHTNFPSNRPQTHHPMLQYLINDSRLGRAITGTTHTSNEVKEWVVVGYEDVETGLTMVQWDMKMWMWYWFNYGTVGYEDVDVVTGLTMVQWDMKMWMSCGNWFNYGTVGYEDVETGLTMVQWDMKMWMWYWFNYGTVGYEDVDVVTGLTMVQWDMKMWMS